MTERQIVTPYLAVADGAAALDWYRDALGAEEEMRFTGDDGRIGHAQIRVHGALIYLSSAYPEMGVVAPDPETSSVALLLEVGDCRGVHEAVLAAGAVELQPPGPAPHGALASTFRDPFGHRWFLNETQNDVTIEEMDAAIDGFTVTGPR